MNILFITCSRIGDAVLTTGLLGEIQRRYPFAKVTIAVDPLPAPLFEDYPLLDDLIVFPKRPFGKHWLTLWKRVVRQRWNLIVDLRGSAISYFLWTKRRVIWKSKQSDPRHKVEQISALIGGKAFSPELWLPEKRFHKTKAYFENQACIAVAPAANWVGKQWPISCFIEIFKRFTHQYREAKIAIFAAPHEISTVNPLTQSLPKEQVLSFAHQNLSLSEVAACIKQCRVFIGNDSGLMHIAAAVGTPTIGLFGPSREQNYRPWQGYDETRNIVIRIPMTYDELKEVSGFSHKSQNCYMTSLSTETVWPILEHHWERFKG